MNPEYDDPELDALLKSHLAAELGGQLGRAERAFQEHLRLSRPTPAARPRRSVRARSWMIGAISSAAVAASVGAAMWVVPAASPTVPGGAPVTVAQHSDPAPAAADPDARAGAESPRPGARAHPESVASASPSPDAPPRWEQVEQLVSSVSVDKGVVLLDEHTPARLVRQVSLEQTEWVDPERGVRVQAIVPRQDVRLISLDTY
jgi:hypothetical protein